MTVTSIDSVTKRIEQGYAKCVICGTKPPKQGCSGWLFAYGLDFCPKHRYCEAAQRLCQKPRQKRGEENMTNFDSVESDKLLTLLLSLLDRIELEEDHTLAGQRHQMARDCGYTVEFREQVSGRLQ